MRAGVRSDRSRTGSANVQTRMHCGDAAKGAGTQHRCRRQENADRAQRREEECACAENERRVKMQKITNYAVRTVNDRCAG